MADYQPYFTIRSRQSVAAIGARNSEQVPPSATHDISRTSFHVKHIDQFAKRLEDSAIRAFPNRGRSSQRYQSVQALLLHWGSDDLFVFPEVEDLEKCLRNDYGFDTDIFAIPTENAHLELMMRLGQLIKDHESPDTLFVIYYGGHARIDESRQSTWCATRQPDSPWLQWSAIQTLLERSKSDVLILLDCCAGAASATFPTGNSITETISASSWDAIAPDPGRYSFTNALIEVLQEWRHRAFSAAMLHAEVLARLKHPRPITINGKHFEARSTPVHFMMTANHKAPSIEIARLGAFSESHSPNLPPVEDPSPMGARAPCPPSTDLMAKEPSEDTPHVMISLALEDDQRLDINAWEQWLGAFPALAKYVKVQGVFKSHSTMMLVSMPVMIWDLLPEDQAVSFVAFIRSNNLAIKSNSQPQQPAVSAIAVSQAPANATAADAMSMISGTTFVPAESISAPRHISRSYTDRPLATPIQNSNPKTIQRSRRADVSHPSASFSGSFPKGGHILPPTSLTSDTSGISQQLLLNQQQSMRRTDFGENVPAPKKFAPHVEDRLESYYQLQPWPNDAEASLIASNLGIEAWHLGVWYHHRRQRADKVDDAQNQDSGNIQPKLISPDEFLELLSMAHPGQVLVFDNRDALQFGDEHIDNAIHLRAPQRFLKEASLDLIQRIIPEGPGREAFYSWRDAQLLVFYSDDVKYTDDCASAKLVANQLHKSGWRGDAFIVKGRFKEFRSLFHGHIHINERIQYTMRSLDKHQSNETEISDWLASVHGDQRQSWRLARNNVQDKVAEQEKILETVFRKDHYDVYRKFQEHSTSETNKTSELVEHLDRGLQKMRGNFEGPSSRSANLERDGSPKVYDDHTPPEEPNEYVEVTKEGDYTIRREQANPEEEPNRRGRGGGLLNKMLRRA